MTGPAPTLSPRQLNRSLLLRQFLLKRAPAGTPLPAVLTQIAGIQAQYAPSMYIGLWSRVEGFERDDLTRALEQRSVVQGTLLRSTIHLVSAEDYWPFALAVREARRDWWLRATRNASSADEFADTAERLRVRLADGPLRRTEVEAVVGKPKMNGIGLWIDLVRVPPSGTWDRRRADLYESAETWLGPPPPDLTNAAAEEHVVRSYLGGFGPAAPPDIADWAGLPTTRVTAIVQRLQLRRLKDQDGRELVDAPGAPFPAAEWAAPVRFLPTWDANLLVHARRAGILREEHRPLIFNTKSPHSFCTFLVDGTVAGTWRYEKGEVALSPFDALPRSALREAQKEAARLAAFHA